VPPRDPLLHSGLFEPVSLPSPSAHALAPAARGYAASGSAGEEGEDAKLFSRLPAENERDLVIGTREARSADLAQTLRSDPRSDVTATIVIAAW